MTRYRRALTRLVIATALLLSYLAGVTTVTRSLAGPSPNPGLTSLTSTQWAAVQASNSLLVAGPTYTIHLPLVAAER